MKFEWDENKNRINTETHGISFYDAQYAFADPKRLILEDVKHSDDEKRNFFVSALLTAALQRCGLPSEATASVFSALVIGGKERDSMKKTIKYTDEPLDVDLESAKIIEDFLPPPDQLVIKEKTVKITLNLSEHSIRFFKREAEKHGVKYQQMLRALIDKYVSAHSRQP